MRRIQLNKNNHLGLFHSLGTVQPIGGDGADHVEEPQQLRGRALHFGRARAGALITYPKIP
jgi:hypothetical protein